MKMAFCFTLFPVTKIGSVVHDLCFIITQNKIKSKIREVNPYTCEIVGLVLGFLVFWFFMENDSALFCLLLLMAVKPNAMK